jgi:hypothetical protein
MGVPPDFATVMDVVVDHSVMFVYIFRAGTVADEHDPSSPHVVDFITPDAVLLAVQIEPNSRASAVREPATLDRTFFCAPQTHQRIAFVDHLPVMLD